MSADRQITTDTWLDIFSFNKNSPAVHNDVFNIGNSLNEDIKTIEAILKSVQLSGYKEFAYDADGNIIRQDIYEDSTKATQLFLVTYSYTGDDLTTITVERTTDGFTYEKTLAYDINGNLESIETVII